MSFRCGVPVSEFLMTRGEPSSDDIRILVLIRGSGECSGYLYPTAELQSHFGSGCGSGCRRLSYDKG